MKHVYKLILSRGEADYTIGHFTSRNKAFKAAENSIEKNGERTLLKRKRNGRSEVIGDGGSYYAVETIWVR